MSPRHPAEPYLRLEVGQGQLYTFSVATTLAIFLYCSYMNVQFRFLHEVPPVLNELPFPEVAEIVSRATLTL